MKKAQYKLNPLLGFILILLGIAGCFADFFVFDLFGKKINYVEDFFPMMPGILSLGFSAFIIGVLINGLKGGVKTLVKFLVIILVAYLIGFLLYGFTQTLIKLRLGFCIVRNVI